MIIIQKKKNEFLYNILILMRKHFVIKLIKLIKLVKKKTKILFYFFFRKLIPKNRKIS